jgi:GAF domain-containing protein/multidrug resistance efflux pump
MSETAPLPETVPTDTAEHPEIRRLEKKVRRLELAIESSRQFNSTLDADALMDQVLNEVAEVIDAEAGSFWVLDDQSNQILCKVATGPAKEKVQGMRLEAGTGIVGWTIANKRKTVVFDAAKDDRFFNQADKETNFITKSLFCVPLMVNQECVGALSMLNKQTADGIFDQEDLEVLEMLALNAAVAIKNAQLFQSQLRIKELNILLTIAKEVTATLDLDRVLLSIVNLGSQIIHYQRALIGIPDNNDRIKLAAESDCPEPDMTQPENKRLLAIMKHVMASGQSLHVTGFNKANPPADLPQIVVNYMAESEIYCLSVIILKDSEGILGLLSMEGIYAALIAHESSYVINILVNTASVAIRNAQLYRSIPRTFIGARLGAKTGKKSRRRLLAAATVILMGLFLITVKLPYDIRADVEVVPLHTTQVTARTDGVVKQIVFQEGALVKKGQVLAELSDPLLALEREKLLKDRLIAGGELRRLESEGEPYEVLLKRLEVESLVSHIRYLERQIQLTRVTAAAGGRVLSQKPEELLDKQVVKGEVITQIAVDDKKQGRLRLPETDVLNVKPGDRISFSLIAMPETIFQGTVTYVSFSDPDAQLGLEVNAAALLEATGYDVLFSSDQLNQANTIRFGMTGTGKIHLPRQTLYRRWFKPLVDRLKSEIRLAFSG